MTPLLFVDLETTGLDPRDRWAAILELGLRLVDGDDLKVVEAASWVVGYPAWIVDGLRNSADEYVREMHDVSGLWRDCAMPDGSTVADRVDVEVLRWVETHAADPAIPLCGSSVHFDRGWLDVHLPRLLKGRTHRLADVSGFRELLLRMGPAGVDLVDRRPGPAGVAAHRVDADLDATLAELRHYRDAIGPALAAAGWAS